ncbi:ErfK/YbiS/YcfS/YnhG family protein [Caenispirillum salinarum AK4]|uniref:ErfK/YbiS/YcfS/YnhG family protein n=1 Tax=Caenispirillum salinarum AK4 TaxID=1238182 RepID=K9GUH3_9PROT|nr:L,D-transpeptidase family protein [Caenispirillum salinarum]EKV29590.1 ErfK/YbiS/YcfS/YnhG family protein [Caenispirillum salinarum AK4]
MITRRAFTTLALSAAALAIVPGLSGLLGLAGGASVAHAADGEERLVTTYTVKKGDTLHTIAQEKGLGFLEMRAANPDVEPWLPEVGREVIVPSVHIAPKGMEKGVLISLGAMRLFHFQKDGTVNSYPIGIGAEGLETPTGETKIVRKKKNPNWYPTENIRKRKPHLPAMVPAGPDNPLGTRAMYLGWPAYLIHGTNLPEGVGRRVSSGCIRMYPWDVESVFEKVDVGLPVESLTKRHSVAYDDGRLWLEVHPTLDGWNALEARDEDRPRPGLTQDIINDVVAAAPESIRINWEAVEKVALEERGYPVAVGRAAQTAAR